MRNRKPHTEETKRKMSLAAKGRVFTEEHKEKLRLAKLGKPGPWKGIKRGPQSAEWRANISAANMGRPAYFPMRRYHYKGSPLRSSWELLVAKIFDKKGIRWEFEPRKFRLGTQTYTPDFYLPDLKCYWEVKGYFGPKSKKTISLFRKQYPHLPLVLATEAVIKALDPTVTREILRQSNRS